MTNSPDKNKKINHLTLVWVREDPGHMEKLKRSPGNLPTAARPTPAESNSKHTALKESRAMEAAYATLTDAFALEHEDDGMGYDFVDHRDPAQVEELRLELSSIDDTEELSREFLRESWWWFPELHDEFRRACSGKGELSRMLAWAAGFEFIVGMAKTVAFRGDGPLSTPLQFASEDPDPPTWNQDVVVLHEQYRHDAIELAGCFSFMMH